MRLRPRNWKEFQHYKDRRPPWIRLYHRLLDDPDLWEMPAEDYRHLTMIWLIASEHQDGDLPEPKKLAFRLRMSEQQVKALLARLDQWLSWDASKPLSEVEQSATPEAEAETEGDAEAEARASADPAPPPPVTPAYVPPTPLPSPGSNGEFIAATALLQDCEIPATSSDIRIMAQLVQIEAKHHGGVEGALQYLVGEVQAGRARGEPVTVFWLKDRKYLAKEKDIYADYMRSTA